MSKVIQLFTEEAVIHSPLYGQVKAETFYNELFAVTNNSKITLENIFLSENNPNIVAAHFLYNWTLKDDANAPFECVDIFEFSSDNKIVDLKIIYDTYTVRGKFEAVTK